MSEDANLAGPVTSDELIQPSALVAATERLVAAEYFPKRLIWWLQHAHSSERWIQFEWAFCLQELTQNFLVLCEHRWIDITLVNAQTAGDRPWESKPAAGLELKWYGNWWVDDFEGVCTDVQKVRKHPFPAAALVLFLHVDTDSQTSRHKWIGEQIRTHGLQTYEEVAERIKGCVGYPDLDHSIEIDCRRVFRSTHLHLMAFYNEIAQQR